MSASIGQPNGGNVTVTFTYTGPTTKVQDTLLDAAFYIAGINGTDISGYTTQQKLNLVDDYLKAHIANLARQYHVQAAITSAQNTAMAENPTKYGL